MITFFLYLFFLQIEAERLQKEMDEPYLSRFADHGVWPVYRVHIHPKYHNHPLYIRKDDYLWEIGAPADLEIPSWLWNAIIKDWHESSKRTKIQ